MKRAALYARYSSDRQNDRSAADQLALCRAWAERNNIAVTAEFTDEALSGASIVNRRGLARLLASAARREFDVVLCEAIDRLSRHQADMHAIRRDLAFRDIAIMTVQDGEVTALHAGVKGMLSELYLADLAQKTRRGQSARVREGFIGGGRSYGYRSGTRTGELIIEPSEAATIVRIFERYDAGETPREIAAALNRDGIRSPRGGAWAASAINGNPRRQNGILHNRLYIGEIVWNRQRFLKDPATGKRVSRPNPESEWQRAEAPQLAIVDRGLFDRVQQRKEARARPHPSHVRKPPFVFSGLVKCRCCGSSYTSMGDGRLACVGKREYGICDNGSTITRVELERRVLKALRGALADGHMVELYVQTYIEQLRERRAADRAVAGGTKRRLGIVKAQIEKLVDAIVNGTPAAAVNDRLRTLETERLSLEAALERADAENSVVRFHPAIAAQYRRHIEDLQKGLGSGAEVFEKVRQLVEKIVVTPRDNKKPAEIEVHGLFAELLSISAGFSPPVGGKLVAGRGFEPLTFRL